LEILEADFRATAALLLSSNAVKKRVRVFSEMLTD